MVRACKGRHQEKRKASPRGLAFSSFITEERLLFVFLLGLLRAWLPRWLFLLGRRFFTRVLRRRSLGRFLRSRFLWRSLLCGLRLGSWHHLSGSGEFHELDESHRRGVAHPRS